jgi:hypothetical protein|tara:strand:+ start:642 stop:749 length:108 start_codon:yes stop_codon:yes gene_type:complete
MKQKEIIYLVVGIGVTYFILKGKGYQLKKFGKNEK